MSNQELSLNIIAALDKLGVRVESIAIPAPESEQPLATIRGAIRGNGGIGSVPEYDPFALPSWGPANERNEQRAEFDQYGCSCDEDDKDAAPGPFGKTYVVPIEYAEDVQADTGTGIEYGASLLFVPSSQHVMAIMDKIPPNSWSFDNELLHAGIEHIVLDPEAGAEITFAWEVK